jgi:Iap family predicted aminopeptidase
VKTLSRPLPVLFVCSLGVVIFLLPRILFARPQAVTVHFEQLPQDVIEARLKKVADKNVEREKTVLTLFSEAGCRDANITEQPVKHQKVPNVICTLPGSTGSEIIVGGHTDHVSAGSGVIDNWSSAALLPSLFQALNGEPRKHTFVFVGFTNEEEGLFGSKFYADQLTPEQIGKIRLMLNMDCIGVGTTEVWMTHSDKALTETLYRMAKTLNLPFSIMNVGDVGDDDSTSFRKRNIPTVMVHSLDSQTIHLIHSSHDQIVSMNMQNYYDTYRLLCAYLACLDSTLN